MLVVDLTLFTRYDNVSASSNQIGLRKAIDNSVLIRWGNYGSAEMNATARLLTALHKLQILKLLL